MTISTTTSRWEGVGNGSTTVFPYNNKIFDATDLRVYLDGVLQTLTTHYTVSGAGSEGGGNVTFVSAPASAVSVVIVRAVANTQLIDYPATGAFPSVATENGLDRRTIISQQHAGTLARSIQYLESDANLPSGILPTLSTLKGRYLKFNASTGAPEAGVFDSGTTSRVVDQFAGDGAMTSFTLSAGVGVAGTTIDIYVSGVHQSPSTYTVLGATLTFTEAPPAPASGVATNIVAVISETVPIGETQADLVSYTPEGTGAVTRTTQDRLRDQAMAEDFGTLQQAVDTGRTVNFGPGTYTGSVSMPASMALEADATADLTGLTFTGALRKGNRFTFGGDYEPTLGQLGHPAPNKGNSWQNALQVTRGTQTAPDSTNLYARTAAYIEMHTSKVHSVDQSSWGNPYMTPALTVENQAHTTFQGALAGAAFRAYSTEVPAGATPPLASLVGIYAIGQTNTGAGNNNHSVWGANFIAAETTGNGANGCVGIEVDLVHLNGSTSGAGPSPGNNYTGYWAQSDAQGVYSTAAFYSSRTAASLGWNYHFYSMTAARNWAIYLVNPSTVTAASGIHIETAAAAGTALEASTAGYNTTSGNGPNVMSLKSQASGVSQTQMVVTSNASNPVNIRVGGGLETVLVGAADSGGAGFRMLRVAN